MKIITNNQPRRLFSFEELPPKEQEYYEYAPEADFFRYKGAWHCLEDFMRAPDTMQPWQGVAHDSYFSGIVLQYTQDFEQVIVGRYYE
jgi:hypothetical protein